MKLKKDKKNNINNTSQENQRPENDDYKVKNTRKNDIIIAIVSLLISIVLWLYVVGTQTVTTII